MTSIVVGLGAGGHAKVVLDILRLHPEHHVVGLLDPDPERWGAQVLGVSVIGTDELLASKQASEWTHFFVGVGSAGDNSLRIKLFERGTCAALSPVDVIHPRAIIAPSAVLNSGLTVMAGAVINASARLGKNVIVNTGAVVEHDCNIGDHVHIAPCACLLGGVHVGRGAHIGAGATVRQGLSIGESSIVGAGAMVVHDVPPGALVVGIPARPLAGAR